MLLLYALQLDKCMSAHDNLNPACARTLPNTALEPVCPQNTAVVPVCSPGACTLRRDNLIHGDLHGGNVMVSPNSQIVTVIDAGLVTGVNLVRQLHYGPHPSQELTREHAC